jgi:hypothetical protein
VEESDSDGAAEAALQCRVRVARLVDGIDGSPGRRPEDYDAALADLDRLPADLPMRGVLAAGLISALLRSVPVAGMARLRRIHGLLEIADASPPSFPQWAPLRLKALALAHMVTAANSSPLGPAPDSAEFDALAATAKDDIAVQVSHRLTRIGLTIQRAAVDNDPSGLRRATREIEDMRALVDGNDAAAGFLDQLSHYVDLMASYLRGDSDAPAALMNLAETYTGRTDTTPIIRDSMEDLARFLRPMQSLLSTGSNGYTRPSDEEIAALRERAYLPGAGNADRAASRASTGMALLAAGHARDGGQVDSAVAEFRAALSEASPDDPMRVFYLYALGIALITCADTTGKPDTLAEAGELLDEARTTAGGPTHPYWSMINQALSDVRRRQGDPRSARQVGLDAMRNHAHRALLQSDLDGAAEVARNAAAEALDLARSCLREAAPGDAVRALDAGRGLILFAATALRDLPTRLDETGRPDLARRWREAIDLDEVPADLRHEVVAALLEDAGTGALLDPPGPAEIRGALAALDADALVYLVPAEPPMLGAAVIVPLEGQPSFLPLTELTIGNDAEVERYLAALAQRDAVRGSAAADAAKGDGGMGDRDLSAETDEREFVDRLDRMCDWAWRAAIGPLLERYVAAHPTSADRTYRLILVPIGDLARIPWQAARRADGVYAVELAAFSYVASARMLCESAARAPVALAPTGLVVGDPDTRGGAVDLPGARAEALAIRNAYYPGARYIGRRPDRSDSPSGRGCARELRDWLASEHPGAGAMLHLACHGVIRSDPDDRTSYLLLADGERLTADEVTARSHRAIALVVLAACRTGVSIRGYDEAYSLGTAFLASGVRSVLSTQWSVPDRATSVLTFMFHHYLVAEGRPVWDALRRAQLWMLDADRKPTDTMPAMLRGQLTHADPAHVVAWAGFIHWGQ